MQQADLQGPTVSSGAHWFLSGWQWPASQAFTPSSWPPSGYQAIQPTTQAWSWDCPGVGSVWEPLLTWRHWTGKVSLDTHCRFSITPIPG